jgi:hypothetical protein
MLLLSKTWGLEPTEVKRHLMGQKWDLGVDIPGLIKHLDAVERGTWTHIDPGLKTFNWLTMLLADAGYEVQALSMHDEDELYARRPLEEA